MKNASFLISALLFMVMQLSAQNVGIGTNSPAQKLDVAGNINTTGNIMVNGTAGSNGQVLSMNGGTMQWMDKSRFNHWATYASAGAATFSVPPGVTEVLIEMWGAGGGGHNPGGGGGSGGYWTGLIPVTGVSTITLTVGAGGAGGNTTTPGGSGGNTSFSCTGFSVIAGGGVGADTSNTGISIQVYKGGGGGVGEFAGTTVPSGFRNSFAVNGVPGDPTRVSVVQVSATEFSLLYMIGAGAVGCMTGQTKRPELSVMRSSTIPDIETSVITGSFTDFAAGGNGTFFGNGFTGGPGRLVIYY